MAFKSSKCGNPLLARRCDIDNFMGEAGGGVRANGQNIVLLGPDSFIHILCS